MAIVSAPNIIGFLICLKKLPLTIYSKSFISCNDKIVFRLGWELISIIEASKKGVIFLDNGLHEFGITVEAVRIEGTLCDRVTLTFSDNRIFEITSGKRRGLASKCFDLEVNELAKVWFM